MIEYPTFGSLLKTFPLRVIKARINDFMALDNRPLAGNFYNAYIAEATLAKGNTNEAITLLDKTVEQLRDDKDVLLKIKNLELLKELSPILLFIKVEKMKKTLFSASFQPMEGIDPFSEGQKIDLPQNPVSTEFGITKCTNSNRSFFGYIVLGISALISSFLGVGRLTAVRSQTTGD